MTAETCVCCGRDCLSPNRVKKYVWVKKRGGDGTGLPMIVSVYFCSLRCAAFYSGIPDEIKEIKEYK